MAAVGLEAAAMEGAWAAVKAAVGREGVQVAAGHEEVAEGSVGLLAAVDTR